jgi:puromycin-sensitive aminopeptidase
MPVVEEKVNSPSKVVYFQESPIMSTYLVAVIVGIFDYVEAFTTDGTDTSVSHYLTIPIIISPYDGSCLELS